MTETPVVMPETPAPDIPSGDALSWILDHQKLCAEIYHYADYCGMWAVDTSGHRKIPFHLVESGTGWLHTQDAPPRLLGPGDLVMFPHDSTHAVSNDSAPPRADQVNTPPDPAADGQVTSILCGFFTFAGRSVWPLLDGLPEVVVLGLGESGRGHGTRHLIEIIIDELDRSGPGASAAINQLACVLFIHIIRAHIKIGNDQGLLGALADEKIGPVLNLIHREPANAWDVNELAASVAMSRSAFASRFKTMVGSTPIRYLTEWRMELASELLTTTELSIAEISERVGYSSEVAFRKAYKSIAGHPPGLVRRNAKKQGSQTQLP